MNTNASKSLPDRVASHIRDLPRSGIRDFFDIVSSMKDVISLGIGEPDFDTPWTIREATMFSLERGATHYSSNRGLLKLRREIASYVRRQFGVSYDPETEILVTVGVSEALDLAVRALIEPGDEALYHEPCYVSYAPLIRMAHGIPVALPTAAETGFRIDPEEIRSAGTDRARLLLLNYPNNPTGAALDDERLAAVADAARERDLLVLSDDIYGELRYDAPHRSIAALPGMRERTILFHGLSKAWAMTGFRIGYACAPEPLIEAMMKIHQYTMLCAPTPSQEAAAEALANADGPVESMREEYRRRRNVIHGELEKSGLPSRRPEGAFYLFVDIRRTGLTSRDFALRLLDEQRVAVVPGTAFGACGEGFIRCSYATSMDEIREAARRIGVFLDGLRA
jgi:aminotransferase